MKTKIFNILALSVFLAACCRTEQPKISLEEIDALFKEYMPYLVDNYEEMQIVLFETENGDVEEMRVSANYVVTQIIELTEPEDDDEERKTIRSVQDNYVTDARIMGTYLTERRKENTVLGVFISLLTSGEQIKKVEIRTNREAVTPLRTPAPSPSDNMIVLQTDAGWCLLERGVGIVQIADTLGHTWKLVE